MRPFLIILTLVFLSCKSNEPTKSTTNHTQTIAFSELSSGLNSGFTQEQRTVIANKEQLNKIWGIAFANYLNKKEIPEIDFEKQTIILVAMGEKTNGGFSLKIKSIEETNNNIIVIIEDLKPGETCMTTSAMTYPYQIIALKKTDKKIIFKTHEKINECEEK